MMLISIFAILCYAISIGVLIPGIIKEKVEYKKIAIIVAVIAMICHAFVGFHNIFILNEGQSLSLLTQNLSLLTIASSVSLLICCILTVIAFYRRVFVLLPLAYSIAIINIALMTFIPIQVITHLENNPALLIHIFLALFSYATLMIALLYSLLVAWSNYQLKHKQKVLDELPPLMVVERRFFHATQVGVVLLTLTLASGFIFIDDIFNRHNAHKMVLSIIAWCIYVVMLWGHHKKGWRGTKALVLTVIASSILTVSYFGSRLIQFLIYHT